MNTANPSREPRGSETSDVAKPRRNKLQKLAPRFKSLRLRRASVDIEQPVRTAPVSPVTPVSPASARRPLTPTSPVVPLHRKSMIPVPPDLSDSKWLEYLEHTGLMADTEGTQTVRDSIRASLAAPDQRRSRIVPEFAHLAITTPSSRPSLDSSCLSSPTTSFSTGSTRRRQAKTPVFRIGQLENKSYGRHPALADKTTSVDLIAAQYRALLESRGGENLELQDSPQLQNGAEFMHAVTDRRDSDGPENILLEPAPMGGTRNIDSMCAAGDEDCMYFKPVAFSAEPSPRSNDGFRSDASAGSSSHGESLGMQICLDLLTKELSSAFAQRSRHARSDATSLQIWTMIEAYEKMQEQVGDMRISPREKHAMKLMLDNWVSALYSVHGSLARADSESEYSGHEDR